MLHNMCMYTYISKTRNNIYIYIYIYSRQPKSGGNHGEIRGFDLSRLVLLGGVSHFAE